MKQRPFKERQAEILAEIERTKPNSRRRQKYLDLQFNNTTKQLMREVGKPRRRVVIAR
jgi:hypothetical protein